MDRYYVIFQGRVQGVGFRYFCQINASNYKLTGWVRNLENGMVDAEIQGTETSINKFISTVTKGNMFIKIEDYSLKKLTPIIEEKSFKIKY